jgi:hypothetical protein
MQPTNPTSLPPFTGELTPEHLAIVHAERDLWMHAASSTTPADRPAAAAAVRRAYTAAGLPPPAVVVWMDSPLAGCFATATLHQLADLPDDTHAVDVVGQLQRQLGGRLEGLDAQPLRAQLEDQLRNQLATRPGDRFADPLGNRLRDPPGTQLEEQVREQLGTQLLDDLGDQLPDGLQDWSPSELGDVKASELVGEVAEQLRDDLADRLDAAVRAELACQLQGPLRDQLGDQLGKQLDPWQAASALGVDRCARRIAGLPPSAPLEALAEALASLGWWWPLRDAAVLTDRPTVIATDDHDRLHADDGPALAWADGYALHAVHGVRVPANVVQAPATITVDQLHHQGSLEVRRVMLERYGYARYARDIGAQRVHTDDTGTLWRCRMPGDEDLVLVEVSNATPEPDGSRRTSWLRVPPDVRTARQAVAWSIGQGELGYRPAVQTYKRRPRPPGQILYRTRPLEY